MHGLQCGVPPAHQLFATFLDFFDCHINGLCILKMFCLQNVTNFRRHTTVVVSFPFRRCLLAPCQQIHICHVRMWRTITRSVCPRITENWALSTKPTGEWVWTGLNRCVQVAVGIWQSFPGARILGTGFN